MMKGKARKLLKIIENRKDFNMDSCKTCIVGTAWKVVAKRGTLTRSYTEHSETEKALKWFSRYYDISLYDVKKLWFVGSDSGAILKFKELTGI